MPQPTVVVKDVDELEAVALAGGEVVGVVGGRDLDRACVEHKRTAEGRGEGAGQGQRQGGEATLKLNVAPQRSPVPDDMSASSPPLSLHRAQTRPRNERAARAGAKDTPTKSKFLEPQRPML